MSRSFGGKGTGIDLVHPVAGWMLSVGREHLLQLNATYHMIFARHYRAIYDYDESNSSRISADNICM